MPLEQHEWEVVERLVLDDLVGTDNPYQTLKTYFPGDVGSWTITNVASENAATIVGEARRAALSGPHPLPVRLIEVLTRLQSIRTAKPADLERLEAYLRRLRAEKESRDRGDPYQARVLPTSGQVFINRRMVREALRRMVAPDPGRPEPIALRVTGERDVGKSYTYELIRHIAGPCGFSHARVVLEQSTTARDILEQLSVQIAPRESPPDADDALKRLRYWALWVAGWIRPAPGDRWWWLVFDECEELDPGSDAVEFIAQLSIAVAEMSIDAGAKRPRLVLLGYGEELDLPLPRKQVVPDAVVPVSEDDLREFFSGCLRDIMQQRSGAVDEARLAEHVEVALRQVIGEAVESRNQGRPYMVALAGATEEVIDVYAG